MDQLTSFQKAALDYNKHISLTANAGSGKTTVLSKRYVEILEKENISIHNIVAITFTERAASELYSKIVIELERKIAEASFKSKRRLEHIRRSLVSAKISTIHSFCIDILKDYAPEAGIDANFSPIDTRTSDEMLNQCIDEVIASNLNNDQEFVKNLIRLFGNRSQLVKNIKKLFQKRKSTEFLIGNIYNEEIQDISRILDSTFQKLLPELFENTIHELQLGLNFINKIASQGKNSEIHIRVGQLLDRLNSDLSLYEKIKCVLQIKNEILTSTGSIRIQGYLNKILYEKNKTEADDIINLLGEISYVDIGEGSEKLNFDLAKFGKEISQFYKEINSKYTIKKQQKSFLDFEDLLLFTQKLVMKKEVKNALAEKYKYIMIDEYQDTNEIQYNIFMPILNNLDTGNLFIVGDEKQSIYMFREAEVELFDKTKNRIKGDNNDSGILDLPHSFRLSPNIAQFTNILFRKLFENPNGSYNEVNYRDLICAYKEEHKGKIEFLISDGKNITEAELVARKILNLIYASPKDYSFGDITILCTKRKNFSDLEEVFSKYKIPFNIVGGKGFYQQQLVIDVYNYFSFLINPENDLALASILRAPFYGLSDVDLTELCLSDGNCIYDKLSTFSKFNSTYELLSKHILLAKVLGINELLRKITIDTGYWAFTASKPNGEQEIANLEKLIHKSIRINEQGFSTLYDFTNFLKGAINEIDDEGQADTIDVNNTVKIMTIHQSKGLEFKVVFLYKTNQKSFDEKIKSKEIVIDKNFGILSKLPHNNNYFESYEQAPIVGVYNFLQHKKSVAEKKRLLYVAITRAEVHLIISAEVINNRIWKGSFTEMIFNSLSIDGDKKQIQLKDELEFMRFEKNEYFRHKELIDQTILITKDIEKININDTVPVVKENEIGEIITDNIIANEKNEIISASKISLFLNCPRKYELTYEFGYGELVKLFQDDIGLEFNLREESKNISSNILGSLLHTFLERNTPLDQLEFEVDKVMAKEEDGSILPDHQKKNLFAELKQVLGSFYKSELFKRINSYRNFYNEREYYKRENDYYLYGIIDKLLIEDDKLIIVDYKSDKVNDANIKEKSETYFNQLLFYSYILLNEFPTIPKFELMIIYLREISYSSSKIITRKSAEKFGDQIKSSVDKIRKKEFTENRTGCKDMKYYLLEDKANNIF